MNQMNRDAKLQRELDRRGFLTAAGGAVTFSFMRPELAFGSRANSQIRLGLVGCGGRGNWLADLFTEHGGYRFVAACDYFPARAERFGDKYGVPPERRYAHLSGYKQMLDDGRLDAIVVETPSYFHPEQAAAGVEAGCHVYLAKPIAVDVPGCTLVRESAEKATRKQLCYLVDFQTRTHPFYQEAVKRVRFGEIGRIVCGDAGYQCGPLGRPWRDTGPESRLVNWFHDRALSGDILTEQNIHAIDVAAWMLDAAPLHAYGVGGRATRDYGDTWDHFQVIYMYPGDVPVSFSSKQCGRGYDDILCRLYGERGTVDTHYFGDVTIKGEFPYKGGNVGNLYRDGAVANIATFYDNITKGRFANETVPPSVLSNLTTILGRTAAYRRCEVTWDEMMKENEKIDARLEGLNA
ncbi:Gfo/Idh/MocA family oxidoreductase [bacterium]|nr:Gfo/Idh/MocA family oxidoreductase [bacterium]